jgi:hypothetical protein
MKKSLLSLGFAALAFGASAQINDTKDGYYADFTDATSYCTINAAELPNNGGVMNGDGSGDNTTFTADNKLTAEGLVLVSNTGEVFDATAREQYFQIPVVVDKNETPDDDTDDDCSKAAKEYGVNVSNDNSVFYITVSSDVDNAELQLFLGGEGEWGPATNSALNEDGNGIVASVTVNTTLSTYAVDFVDVAFNPSDELTAASVWSAWVGKNNINSFGFRSATEGATFTVTEIAFGTEKITSLEKEAGTYGFEAYPNPSSNVINFNYTVNGNATIELSNTLGSTVVSTEGTSVDVSELSSGIYFATLKVNGVSKAIQRVQVQ